MQVILLPEAEKDLAFWVKSSNKSVLKRISKLTDSIQSTPFQGIGKPEPLKHNLSGLWSRRINKEHRLVYEVLDDFIRIHSLRGHY